MIDKINGNGVFYPDQKNKKKNPAVRAYENTPGTKEAAQKKAAKAQKSSRVDAAGSSDSGVILDLSKKAAKGISHTPEQKKMSSWTDALRKLFAPVLQWIRDFWESDSTGAKSEMSREQEMDGQLIEGQVPKAAASALENDLDDGETSLPPLDAIDGALPEAADLKTLGDEAVKSGSIQKLEQYVTQNGTKHLAHNSDLLTYYDRKGKIVEMDETEKHRVLFGDKNVLKL